MLKAKKQQVKSSIKNRVTTEDKPSVYNFIAQPSEETMIKDDYNIHLSLPNYPRQRSPTH